MRKWLDVPFYVVNEDLSEDDVDSIPPVFTNKQPDEYPYFDSTIEQGRKMTIRISDESEIYWFGFKWVKEEDFNEKDYATGATFLYNPGKVIELTAPDEVGTYYLQYYAVDAANNMSGGRYARFNVKDMVNPVLTLNGDAEVEIPINNTYNDPGATWTDNEDGTGIVKANETLDTTKVGPQKLTYTYTDKAGNVSNTVE